MVVTCQKSAPIYFPFRTISVAIYSWSCIFVNNPLGNVILAGQIVIVDDSSIGS